MIEFFHYYKNWILSFHIIFVIFWSVGLLYLPRLFIYHAESLEKKEKYEIFEIMESKLIKIIMRPSMIIVWFLGLLLLWMLDLSETHNNWLYVKIFMVIVLTLYQGLLVFWHKKLLSGIYPKKRSFFRIVNEIPPVLIIIIVMMVMIRPF